MFGATLTVCEKLVPNTVLIMSTSSQESLDEGFSDDKAAKSRETTFKGRTRRLLIIIDGIDVDSTPEVRSRVEQREAARNQAVTRC